MPGDSKREQLSDIDFRMPGQPYLAEETGEVPDILPDEFNSADGTNPRMVIDRAAILALITANTTPSADRQSTARTPDTQRGLLFAPDTREDTKAVEIYRPSILTEKNPAKLATAPCEDASAILFSEGIAAVLDGVGGSKGLSAKVAAECAQIVRDLDNTLEEKVSLDELKNIFKEVLKQMNECAKTHREAHHKNTLLDVLTRNRVTLPDTNERTISMAIVNLLSTMDQPLAEQWSKHIHHQHGPIERNIGTTVSLFGMRRDSDGYIHGVVANVGDSRIGRFSADGLSLTHATLDDNPTIVDKDKSRRAKFQEKISNIRDKHDPIITASKSPQDLIDYFNNANTIQAIIPCTAEQIEERVTLIPHLNSGERIILATDGMWDVLTTDEIQRILLENPDNTGATAALYKAIEARRAEAYDPTDPISVSRHKFDDVAIIIFTVPD